MGDLYWWLSEGNFSVGEGILPHMGEVLTHFRKKRGYRTQLDFAIAAGVAPRTVQEWETAVMTHDHERRILLAKMLRIPPALLGLDWRLVHYKDNTGTHTNLLEDCVEMIEEDSFYHYEDTLVMGWECLRKGGMSVVVDRFRRRMRKLTLLVKKVPTWDKEAWLTLLCQYYQLSSAMNVHYTRKSDLYNDITTALTLATELEDKELVANCLVHRAHIHLEQEQYKHADIDAQTAMQYLSQLRTPLKGNVYLIAAAVSSHLVVNNRPLEMQIKQWQDKTLNLTPSKKMESDRTFQVLNVAGVHHENAKVLLQFNRLHASKSTLKNAHNELNLAWKSLSPDFAEWKMYFQLTEANLYKEEGEIERSAQSGLDALKTARLLQSQEGEAQADTLYGKINMIDTVNPYVRNLGKELSYY